MQKVKIYALQDPRDFNFFYVGATKQILKTRLCGHIVGAKNYDRKGMCRKRAELIKLLLSLKMKPIIVLLEEVEFIEAAKKERRHYFKLKREGHRLIQDEYAFSYDKFVESTIDNRLDMDGKGRVTFITKKAIINKANRKACAEGLTLSEKIDQLLVAYNNSPVWKSVADGKPVPTFP